MAEPDKNGPTTAAEAAPLDPNRWKALVVVLVAPFMGAFDVFVVNVAIPTMQRDLHATFAQLEFVITLYSLAYAAALVTCGRLGDIHGRKRLLTFGMAGFVASSAACGLAPDVRILIVARVLQGLSAAMMTPQVLSMIQVDFPLHERSRALSWYGAVLGFAAVAALSCGGLLVRSDIFGLSWRAIFLVNVPIGGLALVLASRWLRDSRAPHAKRLDLGGVVLLATALFLLIYPLVQGREAHWPAWSWCCLAGSAIALASFVLYERRVAERGGFPLVVLALFRQRAFSAGLTIWLLSGIVTAALFFILSLYLQLGLRYSALAAGVAVVPTSVGFFLGSLVSGNLAVRFGGRLTVASLVVRACMAVAVGLILVRADTTLPTAMVAPLLFLDGLSAALTTVPLIGITLRGIPMRDAGSAAGVFTTVTQVASALGIALIGVIFFGSLGTRAHEIADDVGRELTGELVMRTADPREAAAVVADFRRCVEDRARIMGSASAKPLSCDARSLADADASSGGAVTRSFQRSSARDYGWAYLLAAIFNAAATIAATIVALVALPRAAHAPLRES